MPLVGATPLRIDSETLRKTSVLGFLEGLIQGLCIFWLAVRPPRCSLDEDRIATPIATKILRRTVADGLTSTFEEKLDAADGLIERPQ